MITLTRESVTELNELIEDTVEYWCRQCAENGELVAGETAYRIIEAFALAKQAEFEGLVDSDESVS